MLSEWYDQSPIMMMMVAMFYFIVYSVVTALFAYMMKKDGQRRGIQSINWWIGGYIIIAFFLGLLSAGIPAGLFLVVYLVYRANYPILGKEDGGSGRGAGGQPDSRKTIVIKRFEATPSGRLAVLAAPSGLDVGAQLPLRAGVTRLGASLENDLAFTHDPAISRVHASLREAAEGGQRHWELMDLGSANGTQVWNQALNQFENISRPALIKNGDRFQCGQTTLQLVSF